MKPQHCRMTSSVDKVGEVPLVGEVPFGGGTLWWPLNGGGTLWWGGGGALWLSCNVTN